MIQIYNTLTRRLEDFTPLTEGEVLYYSCGPTVYDFAHIGHARTFVFADILQRTLAFAGYKVKRVMNITDVGHLTSDADTGEDKMEKGALREKKSVWEIAEFYTKDFFNMLNELNIIKPSIVTKATDYIPQMIEMVKKLEKKGYTYTISDGVYFDTQKDEDYGKLTGSSYKELVKGLKAGARIEMVKGKKNPTDFALWKLTPSGIKRQMEWDSPWGKGFPGWHIECSAMSIETLGETFDIHTGGVDHIPVHHTNEIAQSESTTGKKFVMYWLHGEHLLIDGEKMSKSLGNFYRIEDIKKKGFSPLALRYLFFNSSYRTQLNFTWNSLQSAQQTLTNLYKQINILKGINEDGNQAMTSHAYLDDFKKALYDDLNLPVALSVVWRTVKSSLPAAEKLRLISTYDQVLGLDLLTGKISDESVVVPKEILDLVAERNQLRNEKNWEATDKLRKKIEDKGYSIQDSKNGTVITKKKND